MTTAPGEVYTALERGVIDGYGWPIHALFDLNWQEKTKYRVDPGLLQRRGVADHEPRQVQGAAREGARSSSTEQTLAYEKQNDFWKSYNQNEAKRQARRRHPDHHLRRRDQQGVRREGEGDRLGERDQVEPAVRRRS